MTILICDDNARDAQKIKEYLAAHLTQICVPAVLEVYSDPAQFDGLSFGHCDIAFLDIDLGGRSNGLILARRLRSENKHAVIVFVTNFVEFAIAGYEVRALRYVLKSRLDCELIPALETALKEWEQQHAAFTFSVNAEKITICTENILYLESAKRRVRLHLVKERPEPYIFYGSLSKIEEDLTPMGFLRIQKSFLVNMAYIESIRYGFVTLQNGESLTISEKNSSSIRNRYLIWKGSC